MSWEEIGLKNRTGHISIVIGIEVLIRRVGLVFAYLVLIMMHQLFAQAGKQTHFERFSIEHGLSQNSINFIYQDKKGFLWFGTQDGLNRYDGYEFKVYRYDQDNPDSISASYAKCIYEDSKGTLWIGTDGGGLQKYDAEKDRFEHYRHSENDSNSLSSDRIMAIFEGPIGCALGWYLWWWIK